MKNLFNKNCVSVVDLASTRANGKMRVHMPNRLRRNQEIPVPKISLSLAQSETVAQRVVITIAKRRKTNCVKTIKTKRIVRHTRTVEVQIDKWATDVTVTGTEIDGIIRSRVDSMTVTRAVAVATIWTIGEGAKTKVTRRVAWAVARWNSKIRIATKAAIMMYAAIVLCTIAIVAATPKHVAHHTIISMTMSMLSPLVSQIQSWTATQIVIPMWNIQMSDQCRAVNIQFLKWDKNKQW